MRIVAMNLLGSWGGTGHGLCVQQMPCARRLLVLPFSGVSQRTVEPEGGIKNPAKPAVCPLSRVPAGSLVTIKELQASADVCRRLREMGLSEEQQIRLVLQDRNVVCKVCNLRLGLSGKLADRIMVEPVLPNKSKGQ